MVSCQAALQFHKPSAFGLDICNWVVFLHTEFSRCTLMAIFSQQIAETPVVLVYVLDLIHVGDGRCHY
jgi:hypothetical protein